VAAIAIIGGGVVGLGAAMMLAQDGHDVTILERDREAPRVWPEDNWRVWERKGINQFRLPHYFLARYRQVLETELPAVAAALAAAGALRYNSLLQLPERARGPTTAADHDFEVLTGRRPVVEAVVATVAENVPRVKLRRGVAINGLATGPAVQEGIPHVVGVVTDAGERVDADLVVDISGRRSALPRWLEAIGARRPAEEVEDCGFMYYCRHFRSPDGSLPAARGPLLMHLGTISSTTLPADNGTWSVALVTSAKDKALYGLRDRASWERTVRSLPIVAHWLDGEPIDGGVQTIAKIEDRFRSFTFDGAPLATGIVAVGDAWACSNPTVGRGTSIGMMHAIVLRDLLASEGLDDQWAFANAFWESTSERVAPWYRDTLAADRHRMAEVEAGIEGRGYNPDDPAFHASRALTAAAAADPDCLRASLTVALVLHRELDVLSRPGMLDKVLRLGGDWRDRPVPAPRRDKLVAIARG
jgi:2-polyprenyl-6-methoxyphenol hydroxylase-like FAD-dependent oxidoreductase